MLSFNPDWSRVFDAGVCVAVLWLAYVLSDRRLFRSLGKPAMLAAGALLCVPVLWLGGLFSLITSLVVVPWLAMEAYNDTEQPLPRASRRLLTAARIVVFILVILCLLRPRLGFEDVTIQRACAVVLADVSRSMDYPPEPKTSRYERLKAVLEDHADAIEEIKEVCDYRLATFGETFERPEALPAEATGARTNLAEAFGGVMRDLRGAKTAGIILLSDGRDNGRGDPVAAARRLGAPVFAVGLGAAAEAEQAGDSSIQDLRCPERAFLKNAVPLRVRVGYEGPAVDQWIDVKLAALGEQVDTRRVKMPAPGKTDDVDLEYVPQTLEPNLHKLVITVTDAENDRNIRNNRREVFVHVSKSALEVLYVEDEVRWEYKFLRRALAHAPNIKLTTVKAFLLPPAERDKLLPRTEEEWKKLNLIILGDIRADRFGRDQLERLGKFVQEGGGLLMLGGQHTLGDGGYADTPLAKCLPVKISRTDEQVRRPFKAAPTEDALTHTICQLGPSEENEKIWASLPPLSGYTAVGELKSGDAKVLLETPDKKPILAVIDLHTEQDSRAAVFAADTTWRWIFHPEEKYERYHKVFWRQMVLWLTRSDYAGKGGGIWCETDRLRYLAGDTPILTVRASGQKVAGAVITALITKPDRATETMVVGEGPGQYVLGFAKPVKKTGEYRVVCVGRPPPHAKTPEPVTSDPAPFVVQEIDIETENPEADLELLDEVARVTGGRRYDRDDAGKALKAVLERRVGAKIVKPTYQSLWDNVYLYIALGGLLCAEWVARKRKGLA